MSSEHEIAVWETELLTRQVFHLGRLLSPDTQSLFADEPFALCCTPLRIFRHLMDVGQCIIETDFVHFNASLVLKLV